MAEKITVVKRNSDFMAYIDDNKALWGCGKNPDIAVASVVYAHQKELDIRIEEQFDSTAITRGAAPAQTTEGAKQ